MNEEEKLKIQIAAMILQGIISNGRLCERNPNYINSSGTPSSYAIKESIRTAESLIYQFKSNG